jgi:hypothetical protein
VTCEELAVLTRAVGTCGRRSAGVIVAQEQGAGPRCHRALFVFSYPMPGLADSHPGSCCYHATTLLEKFSKPGEDSATPQNSRRWGFAPPRYFPRYKFPPCVRSRVLASGLIRSWLSWGRGKRPRATALRTPAQNWTYESRRLRGSEIVTEVLLSPAKSSTCHRESTAASPSASTAAASG